MYLMTLAYRASSRNHLKAWGNRGPRRIDATAPLPRRAVGNTYTGEHDMYFEIIPLPLHGGLHFNEHHQLLPKSTTVRAKIIRKLKFTHAAALH